MRGALSSPYIPYRWERATAHARCYPANRNLQFGRGWLDEPHAAPHPRCKCGIYAYYRPRTATPFPDADRAWGIVALWGRVEVHSDGMRGEHARIEALSLGVGERRRHAPALRGIAAELEVDVVEWEELAAAAERYGKPVPHHLVAGAATRVPGGGL